MAKDNLPVEAYELGTSIAEYRVDKKAVRKWTGNLVLLTVIGIPILLMGLLGMGSELNFRTDPTFLIIGFFGVVMLVVGLVMLLQEWVKSQQGRPTHYNPAMGGPIQLAVAIIGCGIFFMVGGISLQALSISIGMVILGVVAFAAVVQFRVGQVAVLTFKDGICFVLKHDVEIVRYDDLDNLWFGINQAGIYAVVRRISDHKELRFDPKLESLDKLFQTINEQIAIRLLEKYRATYSIGSKIEFGSLSISKAGLITENDSVRWDTIEKLEFNNEGLLRIKTNGRWATWKNVTVDDIPNLNAFTTFTDEMIAKSVED